MIVLLKKKLICLVDDSVRGCKQGRSEALFSVLAGLGISAIWEGAGTSTLWLGAGWSWASVVWVLVGLCHPTCSAVQGDRYSKRRDWEEENKSSKSIFAAIKKFFP